MSTEKTAAPAAGDLLAVGMQLLTDLQFLNELRLVAAKNGGSATISEASLGVLVENTKRTFQAVLTDVLGLDCPRYHEGIAASLAKQRAESDARAEAQRRKADELMESAKLDPTKAVTP